VGKFLCRSHAANPGGPSTVGETEEKGPPGQKPATHKKKRDYSNSRGRKERHLPKALPAPPGVGVTRAAPRSSSTGAGEGADSALSSHLTPAPADCFSPLKKNRQKALGLEGTKGLMLEREQEAPQEKRRRCREGRRRSSGRLVMRKGASLGRVGTWRISGSGVKGEGCGMRNGTVAG
jgi:hypothetical protein